MRDVIVRLFCVLALTLGFLEFVQAQPTLPTLDYSNPKDFEIGGIKVSGAEFSDDNALVSVAGLKVGDVVKVPGPEISTAIKKLWRLRLFTDVTILQEKTIGEIIFLEIVVEERPRLARYSYKGVKKVTHDDLNDAVSNHLVKGSIVTNNVIANAKNSLKKYYREKGFLDAEIEVNEVKDEKIKNAVRLEFDIDRKERVRIKDINFVGNDNVKPRKLKKQLAETKEKRRIFSSSKFNKPKFEEDKLALINYYNTLGFRDAQITGDSIWRDEDGHLQLDLDIEEGSRYYFRNISWKGNSIYPTKQLSNVLGIEKGDIYNTELLNTRLNFSQDNRDVSSLYMDNGYLFFRVDPIEKAISGDSIDLELRIFEGPQATIDRVTITGNDRTHEHVIRRELRTRPGEKFSRSDIIRSQREIINLGYFNPESLGINTPVNAQRVTVDIDYTVEERPSDQLELSAGWAGQGRGVIGTLGVTFNNFSLRNILNRESWSPLPQGDGQRLSLRAQTNGRFFQSYNVSFTEPWLGGKKPNSFSVTGFYNRFAFGDSDQSNFQKFTIAGLAVGLGTRLKWPDDNFISSTTLSLQNLTLQNWSQGIFRDEFGNRVNTGDFYNFSIQQKFTRTSVNDPIFPRGGSTISLTIALTPPYSLFTDKDYTDLSTQEKFKFLEYRKWRFDAEWYTTIVGKLVLKAQAKVGFVGAYNDEIGISPFERFQLGGDGFANQQFSGYTGVDLISLRGYETSDLENNFLPNGGPESATPIFDKFQIELRYPLSLNPSATIYGLVFVAGGNSFRDFKEFNPFDLKRSVGAGLRAFLPMFGTLGFDYGFGFDKDLPDTGAPSSIFDYGRLSVILGFEPE
ncbi:MAG: outer membrane protein assembly factor BamA [Saprospiraceae bacterium]|nr:outer membrane protein assembly factor BamA [Saprospiraceae bacterium]